MPTAMCVSTALQSTRWSCCSRCRRRRALLFRHRPHLHTDGRRLLRRWTIFPLRDVATINKRLDVVETFFRKPDFRQTVDEHLHRIGDIERIISKVAVAECRPERWCN